MFQCAAKRLQHRKLELSVVGAVDAEQQKHDDDLRPDPMGFPKTYAPPNATLEQDDCFDCYRLDARLQFLRFSHIRLDIYDGCHKFLPTHTLLHTMAVLYQHLRPYTDLYLFLQITFAVTRLHALGAILLTRHTKNRYVALWTMFFVHYYTDYTFSANQCNALVPFETPDQIEHLAIQIGNLVCVRRNVIASNDLFLARDPDQWTSFVDQINQTPEVVQLRKDFYSAPFVFNLDVKKAVQQDDGL